MFILGKTYSIISGEQITLQEDLWNQLIIAIDAGDLQKFNHALNTFRTGWSTDINCPLKDTIKTGFCSQFNKIKIKITTSSWSFRRMGWVQRSVELSPLALAAKSGNKDIVEFLIRNMDQNDTSPYDPIKVTADHYDENPDIVDIDEVRYVAGAIPLHLAAAQGHDELIKFFSADQKSLNTQDKQGNTALHLAAYCGRTDIVQTLMAKGANEKIINVGQYTFDNYALYYNISLSQETTNELAALQKRTQKIVANKSDNTEQKFDDLNIALNAIKSAKTRIGMSIKNANTSQLHQNLASYQDHLSSLEKKLKIFHHLLNEGYQEVKNQEKCADNIKTITDAKRRQLNNMKQRTIAITHNIVSNIENGKTATDYTTELNSYNQAMIENVAVLSDAPKWKKWGMRAFFVILGIGLALTGIGIIAEIIGVSFAAALSAAFSLSALKAAPAAGGAVIASTTAGPTLAAGVTTGIAASGIATSALGWGLSEFGWLNRRGKNTIAAIEEDLDAINTLKLNISG